MPPLSSHRPNALVFDLDGTLLDTAPDLAHAVNEVLLEMGCTPLPDAAILPMIGNGVVMLLRRALNAAALEIQEEEFAGLVSHFLDIYFRSLIITTTPYPGVIDTLHILRDRGWKMGICTNKPQRHSLALLDRLKLAPFFSAVVGGDAAPVRKPDPAHVLATLAALDSPPHGSVMIGDSDNDTRAGSGAGCRTILFTYGYGKNFDPALADARLEHFDELPQTLDSFGLQP